MKKPIIERPKKPIKRADVSPARNPNGPKRIYKVSGYAMVPVECRMYVEGFDELDAQTQAYLIWSESSSRRHEWVVPGTVDERHPEDWYGHAELADDSNTK
jgi:hypothetical protein